MRNPSLLALAALIPALPAETDACGGFFCSQVPVDQGGENIVFALEDGMVTAHIQIRYVGAAEQFAWILPLPSQPEPPEVSTDLLFTNLGVATQPRFSPIWHYNDGCYDTRYGDALAGSEDSEAGDGGAAEPPEVTVEFQGAVGPYDAVVLSSTDAQAVEDWLVANSYDVPKETADMIAPYVTANYHFVALKLQNDRQTGDIVPVKVRFAWDHPCVPLRLTAIAATEDMFVRMWVFGADRSIPLNYRHVLIDEAKVDWLSYGGNYTQVVTDAANEANGRAFVTEFAGGTEKVQATWGNLFYTEGQYDLAALAALDDPAAFVDQLLIQGFPSTPQMQQLLRTHIPMPQALVDLGITEADFYNSLAYWQDQGYLDGFDFDPAAFAADLETLIVAPLIEAQALMDGLPYLTRLFTTMSPEEMTEDPIFGATSDLGDVSNEHTADIYVFCDDTGPLYQVVLQDGRSLWIHGDDPTASPEYDDQGRPVIREDPTAQTGTMARLRADLPGSEAAEQLFEDRERSRVYDNGARIDDVLAAHNAAVLRGTAFEQGDGCACAIGDRRPPASYAGAMLAAALLILRRRRALPRR